MRLNYLNLDLIAKVIIFLFISFLFWYFWMADPNSDKNDQISELYKYHHNCAQEVSNESEAIFWQLYYVCELSRAEISSSIKIRVYYGLIVTGFIPLLVAFYRGKAGYTHLAFITLWAGVCSFSLFAIISGDTGYYEYLSKVEERATESGFSQFWRAGKPADEVISEAKQIDIMPVLHNARNNYSAVNYEAKQRFLAKYFAGILSLIGGWGFATLLSLRIKTGD